MLLTYTGWEAWPRPRLSRARRGAHPADPHGSYFHDEILALVTELDRALCLHLSL
jgi:hypothetical protein